MSFKLGHASFRLCFCFVRTIAQFSRIGKFLFVKIINSLADIQIKFTHVYIFA